MSKPVLIIRNVPRENPGIIEIILREHAISYLIRDAYDSADYGDIRDYSALVVLGGPDSANDTSRKMINEIDFVRNAIQSGIPYLGICLGMQVMVKALGGNVEKCKTAEIGFRDPSGSFFKVMLTPEGREDILFYNLPDNLTVFQLHGETVMITTEMKLLATGDYCRNQIVKAGEKAYGIQSHFELTGDLLDSWAIEDEDLCKLDKVKLSNDFEAIKQEYFNTGRRLFQNFLDIAGLIRIGYK